MTKDQLVDFGQLGRQTLALFLNALLLPTQLSHQLFRVTGSLLKRLALVHCRHMLHTNVFPFASHPAFTVSCLLNACGQLRQSLFSIRNQYRQVEHVLTSSVLFSQGSRSLLDQLFHLPIEHRERLLPLLTVALKRGRRGCLGMNKA
ncbi:MAG: hypothetical protein ACREMY_15890, partial [bacterium]